jgi:Mg-chelatase subunit ChlD
VPAGPASPFLVQFTAEEIASGKQSVGLSTWNSCGITLGDTLVVQVKEKNNVERSLVILLDASGSMRDNNKMVKAKASAEKVLRRLPADTEVALIVFYDCGRIRVEQAFTLDPADVIRILPGIQPSGGTPLAAATKFAKDYMKANASGKQLDLIILSDGQETCGGDPVKAARE